MDTSPKNETKPPSLNELVENSKTLEKQDSLFPEPPSPVLEPAKEEAVVKPVKEEEPVVKLVKEEEPEKVLTDSVPKTVKAEEEDLINLDDQPGKSEEQAKLKPTESPEPEFLKQSSGPPRLSRRQSFIKVVNAIMLADSVIDPESEDDFKSESSNSKGSTATEERNDPQKADKKENNLQKSEYDDFDDFDIDVNQLKDVKGFSSNKMMQGAMAGLASLNVGEAAGQNLFAFEKSVDKKRRNIESTMQKAPFWRKMDKFSYILGTCMIIALTFFLGRYPNNHIYTFVCFLVPALLGPRYVHYYINGWHYFLFDFCYMVNFLTLFFLISGIKSQALFITLYLFANGPLAFAIVAFRNSLVYHKIDYLTSLAIHTVPMIVMTNARWHTIPEQAHLPEDQQRFFNLQLPENIFEFFVMFIMKPMGIYFIYLTFYGTLNFVVKAQRIKEQGYQSTFVYWQAVPWMKKMTWTFGEKFAPLVFMSFFVFYVLSLILLSAVCFYSFYFNMLCSAVWLIWSFYNGANFYMESFSRKYEKQLAALQKYENTVKESQTSPSKKANDSPNPKEKKEQ